MNNTAEELIRKFHQFSRYMFEEVNHKYTYNGYPVLTSVTQLIDRYVPQFDSDFWATKKAKQMKLPVWEIRARWKFKAEISQYLGTLFHSYMEHMLAGKLFDYVSAINAIPNGIREHVSDKFGRLMVAANSFIMQNKEFLIPVKSEFIVGLEDKVAGQIDEIFFDTRINELVVYDWKTNGKFNSTSEYKEKLLPPFEYLDACELSEYSIQLNLYRCILKRMGIETASPMIVWFNQETSDFASYKVYELENECNTILNQLV